MDARARVTSHEGVGFPRLDLGSREVRPSDLLLPWIRLFGGGARAAWSLSLYAGAGRIDRKRRTKELFNWREDGCLTVRNVRMRRVCRDRRIYGTRRVAYCEHEGNIHMDLRCYISLYA